MSEERPIENAVDAGHRLVTPRRGGRVWRVMRRLPGTDVYSLKGRHGQWCNVTKDRLEEGWIYAD